MSNDRSVVEGRGLFTGVAPSAKSQKTKQTIKQHQDVCVCVCVCVCVYARAINVSLLYREFLIRKFIFDR